MKERLEVFEIFSNGKLSSPKSSSFDITVASEIMAILCLSEDILI